MIFEYPLHRCPDCNQKPIIETVPDRGHVVHCQTCGPVMCFSSSIEKAVHEWNATVRETNLLLERAD